MIKLGIQDMINKAYQADELLSSEPDKVMCLLHSIRQRGRILLDEVDETRHPDPAVVRLVEACEIMKHYIDLGQIVDNPNDKSHCGPIVLNDFLQALTEARKAMGV